MSKKSVTVSIEFKVPLKKMLYFEDNKNLSEQKLKTILKQDFEDLEILVNYLMENKFKVKIK